jgi:RNA polymerase sigma-70 factor (ECF subfamily)
MSLKQFKNDILPVKDKLYRFANSILRNGMEAEDVVQEVFIRLWQRRDHWSEIENIEALTMKMTKNLALDKLRSKHNRTNALPDHADWRDDGAQPDEMTERNDTISRIRTIMQKLPEKHRLVMQLRDIEGLSYEEICTTLDMPMSQVKINLFRARKQIREHLIKTNLV